MRSRGGLTLLRVLFILIVLCHTGFALECYVCESPLAACDTTANCTGEDDSCLIAVSGPRTYRKCWQKSGCTADILAAKLFEKNIDFRCCQDDKCNVELSEPEKVETEEKETENDGTVTLSGKTMLVVLLVLVTSWNHFL